MYDSFGVLSCLVEKFYCFVVGCVVVDVEGLYFEYLFEIFVVCGYCVFDLMCVIVFSKMFYFVFMLVVFVKINIVVVVNKGDCL